MKNNMHSKNIRLMESDQMLIQIQSAFSRFPDQKVMVIGDFILDEYIKGSTGRVSQEAPVPVVDVSETQYHLGGAANAALNLKSLGAKTSFCTHVGLDEAGQKGIQLLKKEGFSLNGLFTSMEKQTQFKTRIVSENQMVVRIDQGNVLSPDHVLTQAIAAYLEKEIPQCAAILLTDYDKGFFSPAILQILADLRRKYDFYLAVDSKRLTYFRALAPDLVKPNRQEAEKLMNRTLPVIDIPVEGKSNVGNEIPVNTPVKSFYQAIGKRLFQLTQAKTIALTMDKEGAVWFEAGNFVHHEPAPHIPFPHVCGAGDCFISAAVLATLCVPDKLSIAKICTEAAAIVVEKKDTASCNLTELMFRMNKREKVITSLALWTQLSAEMKARKEKIVLTNGCFDLLHNGHIHFLHKAKQLGDILVVALNTDVSITEIKGEGRPINQLKDRIEILSALSCVDYIVPFGGSGGVLMDEVLKVIQPAVFTKGENYRFQLIHEQAVLKSLKIPLVFIPLTAAQSTAQIIHKIKVSKAYAI